MVADGGAHRWSWSRLALTAFATTTNIGLIVLFVGRGAIESAIAATSAQALAIDSVDMPPIASDTIARAALWLDPLNQNALNTAYVHAVRRKIDSARLVRYQSALSRLGWRSTATQQNLLAVAAARGNFPEALDRVDSLLRRNRFVTQFDPFIAAVESDAETRDALVNKLRADPPWRELLLVRGGELRGSKRLSARAATMNALVDKGAHLSRVEVAPFLTAAVTGGEVMPAYQLWLRTLRRRTQGGLLYDGDFKISAVQGVRSPLPVPFEWKFENGDGYTTQVGSNGGLFLRWSGRGVPLLLSQPVRSKLRARGYRLRVDTDLPSVPIIANKLAFTLSCGDQGAAFRPVAHTSSSIDFTIIPLPCAMPLFAMSGRLQDVAEPITVTINKLHLMAQ